MKDELTKKRSIPFEDYFGEMDINKSDKDKRIKLAYRLYDELAFLFELISITAKTQSFDELNIPESISVQKQAWLIDIATERLTEAFEYEGIKTERIKQYVLDLALFIVTSTLAKLYEEYTLSDDRAMFVAENESNTAWNNDEFADAKEQGMTMKTWHTMEDKSVRESHREVDLDTIPIDEAFVVGDSLMMFPKDESLGASAEEIVNCRCSISYS